MDALTKDRRRSFMKHMGAVVGTIFCLQVMLWGPPAFTGTLQDVEKRGEKAAESTEKAAGKGLHDTQKSGGKASQATENAAGEALQKTEKAGGQGLQELGNPLKGVVGGQQGGSGIILQTPGIPGGGGESGQGPFQPSQSGGDSSLGAIGSSAPSYSDPSAYPTAPMPEPQKAPDFSLGSTEGAIYGGGAWYEKLGSSGIAPPPGSPGQGYPWTPFSQGGMGPGVPGPTFPFPQGSTGQGPFGPASSQNAPRPGGPPVPFFQDTTGR